jgi:hypothetical protein
MTWCVLGVIVVVIAGFDGGPKSVDDWCLSRIFGAEPDTENPTEPMPKCNGIGLGQIDCPRTPGGSSCGPRQIVFLSADSGGINDKRYDRDPDKPACRGDLIGCPGDLFDYKLTTTACIPQQVP